MPFPFTLVTRFKVFTSADAELEPTVAAGKDGRFSIEWEAAPTGGDIRSYVFQGSTIVGDGGGGSIPGLGTGTATVEQNPDTAFLNNGAHVLVYEQVLGGNRDIYLRYHIKNADGTYTLQNGNVLVNSATVGDQFRPEITALAGGGFVVGWEDNNDTTIKLQRYDSSGVALGAVISVAARSGQVLGSYSFDLTALNNGGFAIAYRGDGGLQTSKISAFTDTGVPIVSALDSSAQVVGATHGGTSLTQLANGDIAAVWYDSDGGGVGYRLFNAGFVSLTGDLLISNTGLTGAIGEIPRVAATLDGRFMVVFSNFGSFGGVYGQMVNANGTLDGAAVLLSTGNTTTAGDPEIETTADGRLVVSWQEAGDVYAAVYDPRTAALSLAGTSGNDNYVGSAFGDTIYGLGGNDRLFGGDGFDLLIGGEGNDTLEGGLQTDTLYGGNGDDVLYGATEAGPTGSAASKLILGEVGNDTLVGASGSDTLYGGADNDSLTGNNGDDSLYGETGNDVLDGGIGLDQLFGGDGGDFILGGNNNDTLDGGAGNDILFGDADDDTVSGGDGVDYVYGGTGNNSLFGGADLDILVSEGNSDTMDGGTGQNYYYRLAIGASTINGGSGVDIFVGGSFNSFNTFNGNDGDDYALGGAGNELLRGGAGNDILIGGGNNDSLDGGSGVNYLYADGFGSDRINVNAAVGGTQLLVQFEAGGVNDFVALSNSNLANFAAFQVLQANLGVVISNNLLQNTAAGAVLTLYLGSPNQTDIWFLGTLAAGLTSADFSII
jgi:Ca2+-binding RTX toxin-like protein